MRGLGTRDVLVIGDRLDTDIDGAAACGVDALLVLTGVHGLADLATQPVERWPRFIAQDLRSLTEDVVTLDVVGDAVVSGNGHPLVHAVETTVKARLGQRVRVPEYRPTPGPSPIVDVQPFRLSAGSVGA